MPTTHALIVTSTLPAGFIGPPDPELDLEYSVKCSDPKSCGWWTECNDRSCHPADPYDVDGDQVFHGVKHSWMDDFWAIPYPFCGYEDRNCDDLADIAQEHGVGCWEIEVETCDPGESFYFARVIGPAEAPPETVEVAS